MRAVAAVVVFATEYQRHKFIDVRLLGLFLRCDI